MSTGSEQTEEGAAPRGGRVQPQVGGACGGGRRPEGPSWIRGSRDVRQGPISTRVHVHRSDVLSRTHGRTCAGSVHPGPASRHPAIARPAGRHRGAGHGPRQTGPTCVPVFGTAGPRRGRPLTPAPGRPGRAPDPPPTAPTPAGLPDTARSQAAAPGTSRPPHVASAGARGRGLCLTAPFRAARLFSDGVSCASHAVF